MTKLTGCHLNCEQTPFSLKIYGKEGKTSKRASLTVCVMSELQGTMPLATSSVGFGSQGKKRL